MKRLDNWPLEAAGGNAMSPKGRRFWQCFGMWQEVGCLVWDVVDK